MGWAPSGKNFHAVGWVQKLWVGLGLKKVTHVPTLVTRGLRRRYIC